jgi:hypothetical protein
MKKRFSIALAFSCSEHRNCSGGDLSVAANHNRRAIPGRRAVRMTARGTNNVCSLGECVAKLFATLSYTGRAAIVA